VSLAGAPASAYTAAQTITDLAAALTSFIGTSGVSVVVTSVTDADTGAVLYSASSGGRRRLTGASVVVAFVALVPASISGQASVAASIASAVAPSGASATAFSTSLLSSLAAVVATSGNAALAPGGVLVVSGVALAAPSPLPFVPSAGVSAGATAGGPGSAAVGAGVGIAALLLLSGGLLFLRERRAAAAQVTPGIAPSTEAGAPPAGHLTLRVPLQDSEPPRRSSGAAAPLTQRGGM
jgi:hypothetical protein